MTLFSIIRVILGGLFRGLLRLYRGYIGIMEEKMEIATSQADLFWGFIKAI